MARASKYKPENAETLRSEMANGLSFEACCGVLGICKDTGYDWIKRYPDFKQAKAEGEALGQMFWERKSIDGLWSSADHKFNSTVFVFTMKNRFNWRDKKELSGSLGIGLALGDLTDAQVDDKIAEILSRLPQPTKKKRR